VLAVLGAKLNFDELLPDRKHGRNKCYVWLVIDAYRLLLYQPYPKRFGRLRAPLLSGK
jgi:hypothetical protein